MGADFPMIPHESAFLSIGCKLTSLWGRPMSDHCEGFCTSGAVVGPLRVAPEGVRGDMSWSKAIDFYALSCGSFRKKARNLIETAQRKSQIQYFDEAPQGNGRDRARHHPSLVPVFTGTLHEGLGRSRSNHQATSGPAPTAGEPSGTYCG